MIQNIFILAKQRVYILRERNQDEQEYMKNPNNIDEIKKTKKVFCSIEREYGKPYAQYLTRWNIWRDKAFERIKSI